MEFSHVHRKLFVRAAQHLLAGYGLAGGMGQALDGLLDRPQEAQLLDQFTRQHSEYVDGLQQLVCLGREILSPPPGLPGCLSALATSAAQAQTVYDQQADGWLIAYADLLMSTSQQVEQAERIVSSAI